MMKRMRKIYIIAGEASGDALAAKIIESLKIKYKGQVEFYGIGGKKMQTQGMTSLFSMQELSLIGIIEIIPKFFRLKELIKLTLQDIKKHEPDMLITIDAPAFNLRIAKGVKSKHIKKVHVVAPTVWAWKAYRAKKFAKIYDKILCLYPFEPEYFKGLPTEAEFIGHTLWETPMITDKQAKEFRSRRYIDSRSPLLLLLPGSRMREIQTLMPIFIETACRLRRHVPSLRLAIMTLPHLREQILSYAEYGIYGGIFDDVLLVDHAENKEALMASSDMALAASGTVALELAKAKTPFVVAYRLHPITFMLTKMLVKVKFASMVNILAGKLVNAECLQSKCKPENLSEALRKLFKDEKLRKKQVKEAFQAVSQLKLSKVKTSSVFAADILYNELERKKR